MFYEQRDVADKINKEIKHAMRRHVPEYTTRDTPMRVDVKTLIKPNAKAPPKNLTTRVFSQLGRRTANMVRVPIDKAPGELLFC